MLVMMVNYMSLKILNIQNMDYGKFVLVRKINILLEMVLILIDGFI